MSGTWQAVSGHPANVAECRTLAAAVRAMLRIAPQRCPRSVTQKKPSCYDQRLTVRMDRDRDRLVARRFRR